jgi:hypothetical protein
MNSEPRAKRKRKLRRNWKGDFGPGIDIKLPL